MTLLDARVAGSHATIHEPVKQFAARVDPHAMLTADCLTSCAMKSPALPTPPPLYCSIAALHDAGRILVGREWTTSERSWLVVFGEVHLDLGEFCVDRKTTSRMGG